MVVVVLIRKGSGGGRFVTLAQRSFTQSHATNTNCGGVDFRGRVKTLDLVIVLPSSKRFTSDENQQIASLLMNRKVVCVGFHLASAGVAMSVWTPMAMGTPPQRMLPSSSDTATL